MPVKEAILSNFMHRTVCLQYILRQKGKIAVSLMAHLTLPTTDFRTLKGMNDRRVDYCIGTVHVPVIDLYKPIIYFRRIGGLQIVT